MTRDEILLRLARLDAGDREWLLGELPPALRQSLAEMNDEPRTVPPARVAEVTWESVPPAVAAVALEGEPAWFASAATRLANPQWREAWLAACSTRRRQDIESADRSGRSLSPRAAKFAIEWCRGRGETGAAVPQTPPSRFSTLVDDLRRRLP
jgi:hypothetical protein